MHDLTTIDTEVLADRFEELQRGPLYYGEVHTFYCACDEDCAYDNLAAVEAELVRRELVVTR